MSVRSVRQMNDSPDGVPAGAAETVPEPSHSWLAALRARLGLPGAPTLRAMLEDAPKGAALGRPASEGHVQSAQARAVLPDRPALAAAELAASVPELGRANLSKPIASTRLRRPMIFVPPSMPAANLLIRMQSTHIHMAL